MSHSPYERLHSDITEARRASLKAEQDQRELARIRSEHASILVSLALIRLRRILDRKYDPNQLRVPAGQPGGGRWTSDNTGAFRDSDATLTERVIEATRRGRRLTDEECWEQYERDLFHCKMVGLKSCYAQAAERFSACLAGRPIPPLNY